MYFLRSFVLPVFLALLCLTPIARAADTPLASVQPETITPYNPSFGITPSSVNLPVIGKQSALLFRYSGIVSYRIPAGAASFHAVLDRTDSSSDCGAANSQDMNHTRVRFGVDNETVYDTILDACTPPEQLALSLAGRKTFTIESEEESGGNAIYLAGSAFSGEPISGVVSSHLLPPNTAYANIGAGARQIAFHDYYPGESVPLHVEFAGSANHADVSFRTSPLYGKGVASVSVPVMLHSSGSMTAGDATWKVPGMLGPAAFEMQVSVARRQAYFSKATIAISTNVNLSAISDSTFGVHVSYSGLPLLADDYANLWGAKWGRVFLRWEQIEAQPGKYDWSKIDRVVSSYLEQHMIILGVMGEIPPHWMTQPATEMPPAYDKFVQLSLAHFRGKIQYWDVYNEIDSKYRGGIGFDKTDPQGDIRVLRQEMQTMRGFDPSLKTVCCSPGASSWLQYSRRLYDAGLLSLIDIVSLHPYQVGPPEESDNGFTYVEAVQRLESVVSLFGTHKPVWSTEANWLIGPQDTRGVSAPNVTEHEQSEYVVRVNLLSLALNAPYFVHMPFYTSFHRQVMVDSLASYTAMAANFSGATKAKLLQLPDEVFGVSASTSRGNVTALWANRSSPINAKLSDVSLLSAEDMYGNPLNIDTSHIQLSGQPIYLISHEAPVITVDRQDINYKSLPDPRSWPPIANPHLSMSAAGIRVVTPPNKSDLQALSPPFPVSPNACYLIQADLTLHRGGLGLVITDPDTHQRLREEYMFTATGSDEYSPIVRVWTKNDTRLQLLLQAVNPTEPDISDFAFSNPRIKQCP